jgi:hypothetical protein
VILPFQGFDFRFKTHFPDLPVLHDPAPQFYDYCGRFPASSCVLESRRPGAPNQVPDWGGFAVQIRNQKPFPRVLGTP